MGTPYVTFLPDGRTIATSGPIKKLRFFEVRTGKEIRSLDAQMDVLVSADGKTLASRKVWSKDPVRLWNLAAEKEIGPVEGGKGSGGSLALFVSRRTGDIWPWAGSGDNHRPDDPPLCILNAATGKEVQRFPMRDTLGAVTFSPDGKLLATAKAQNVPPLVQVSGMYRPVTSVRASKKHRTAQEFVALRISPDGRLLAAAANQARAQFSVNGEGKLAYLQGGRRSDRLGIRPGILPERADGRTRHCKRKSRSCGIGNRPSTCPI